jgi:hypothetical protein
MPLLPSPGPYCNALHATHGGYLPGSSQCSPEKCNSYTSPFRQPPFYLRELHDFLATRTGWGGRVRLTYQLRRDRQWWPQVPSADNERSIFSSIETACLHCDSSCYG